MPPRNNPLPAAVRLFNCSICDKGYPRQVDYENHLRSYDHNHRQRLADMKKLTASNDPESGKPKQSLDMRSINVEEASKMGVGRFTKIGGGGAVAGGRFKKVGVAVGKDGEKKEEFPVDAPAPVVDKGTVLVGAAPAKQEETKKEDIVMADEDEEEAITWEEYDFTKPTGCDHTTCGGCKTDGIGGSEWVAI